MAARDLLDEALRLSPAERGRLVHDLIRSIDDFESDDPAAVEKEWAEELEQRAARALKGETKARQIDAVCDELDAKRGQRT